MRKYKVGDIIVWKDTVYEPFKGKKGIIEGIEGTQLLKYTVRVLEGVKKGALLKETGKNFVDEPQMNRNGANS